MNFNNDTIKLTLEKKTISYSQGRYSVLASKMKSLIENTHLIILQMTIT